MSFKLIGKPEYLGTQYEFDYLRRYTGRYEDAPYHYRDWQHNTINGFFKEFIINRKRGILWWRREITEYWRCEVVIGSYGGGTFDYSYLEWFRNDEPEYEY